MGSATAGAPTWTKYSFCEILAMLPQFKSRSRDSPQSDQSDLRRYSPLAASSIFLQHLRDSWNHKIAKDRTDLRLEDQEIVLTVPASFDEIARGSPTFVQMAGLKNITLLEEPQAAFYSWIATNSEEPDPQKHYQIISQTPKILSWLLISAVEQAISVSSK